MQVEIRKLNIDDYDELAEAMQKAYPDIDDNVWSKRNIQKLTSIFAEGQICILVDGKLAAAARSGSCACARCAGLATAGGMRLTWIKPDVLGRCRQHALDPSHVLPNARARHCTCRIPDLFGKTSHHETFYASHHAAVFAGPGCAVGRRLDRTVRQ